MWPVTPCGAQWFLSGNSFGEWIPNFCQQSVCACCVCVCVCGWVCKFWKQIILICRLCLCALVRQCAWALMCVFYLRHSIWRKDVCGSLSGCRDWREGGAGGGGDVVGRWGGGCRASVPLRQSASATKRIANIACLAFSEGNKPIDFWLCSLFYLHRRALVPSLKRNWLIDGGEDERGGGEGWGGIRREEGTSGVEHGTELREDS